MAVPSQPLPIIGQPNSTEDSKIRAALLELQGILTAGVDSANLVPGGHTHTFRWSHTFTISDDVRVPSGDVDYIPPFFVPVAAGQTTKLIAVRHRINAGTSATFKLQNNGADITGFTGIAAATTTATTDPADVTLAANDMLALVVTAVSGTPKNLSASLYFESVA